MADFPKEERTEMGLSGRRFYEREMSFEIGYQRIVRLFSRLLARGGGKPS